MALVTGARVKLGYAVALRLLRNKATVIATTRFPNDAAQRFSQVMNQSVIIHDRQGPFSYYISFDINIILGGGLCRVEG